MSGLPSSDIIDAPFGAWESPITSKAITAGSVRLGGGLFVCPAETSSNDSNDINDSNEQLLWLEGRPQEGGRYVLCRYDADAKEGSSNENLIPRSKVVNVSPAECNVRTRVHEYGGGSVVMGPSMEELFVSDFATQQLCRLKPFKDGGGTFQLVPIPIPTGDESVPNQNPSRYRFADGVYHQGNIYSVREDHGPDGQASPQDVQNTIVVVDVATGHMSVLASGNDFYAAPRLDASGTQLAFITWNHPSMPWDGTELRLLKLEHATEQQDGGTSTPTTTTKVVEDTLIAGGVDADDSIMQPLWHPSGDALYYLSDESGFYNLYRAPKKDAITKMKPTRIWTLEHDLGGAAPGWMLGQQGFTFLPQDGRLAAVYQKNGKSVLVLANVEGEEISDVQEYGTDEGLPMMFGSLQPARQTSELFFIGGSPSTPTSIYKWNWQTKQPAELLICSSSQTYDEGIISVPLQVEFSTTDDRTAFGYFYPPKNDKFTCTTDENGPPLLVKAHGGPTACTGTSFNANIQFWTSRGFAILDVDYGGSTGYGREYRRRLRNAWGIVDIDDVCNGAKYLVKHGLADGNRLCIDGGSAGGFTTLAALAFRDVFSAGCSLYGVADLTALAGDTHKFESRYLDGLVGKYPQDEAIYKERSPIESVGSLSCPILLLQGDEDKIVPPNQAEMMHAALLKKGIPTCLKIYKGEQHGFRKAENIEDALDSELAFYGKVFGIPIPDAVDLKIDNLK